MNLRRSMRKYFCLRRHSQQRPAFARVKDELRARTKAFSASTALDTQTNSFIRLFHSIWTGSSERAFNVRLLCWIRMLEHDDLLRLDFQETFQAMIFQVDSVALLAEAGLPRHHAVFSEGLRRVFNRLLPSAMAVSDSSRLMVSSLRPFPGCRTLPASAAAAFRTPQRPARAASERRRSTVLPVLQSDLRQALCLIATRTAGRGVTAAMRERGGKWRMRGLSPFYQLIFATQQLVGAPDAHSAAAWLYRLERGSQQLPQGAWAGSPGHGDHRGQCGPGARPAEYRTGPHAYAWAG